MNTKEWTEQELETIVSHYMLMPMSLWPAPLTELVKEVGKLYGSSGDVFADTIRLWIESEYQNEAVMQRLTSEPATAPADAAEGAE